MAGNVITNTVTTTQSFGSDGTLTVMGTGAINSSTIGVAGGAGKLNVFGSIFGADGAALLEVGESDIIVGAAGVVSGKNYGIKAGSVAFANTGTANLNSAGTIFTETGTAISLFAGMVSVMNSGLITANRIRG